MIPELNGRPLYTVPTPAPPAPVGEPTTDVYVDAGDPRRPYAFGSRLGDRSLVHRFADATAALDALEEARR